MKTRHWNLAALFVAIVSLCAAPLAAHAFDSGSTGIDGEFNPTVDTELQLPPDGIFNFTEVNIPAGVTVTVAQNTTNTPVTILASGDVTIAGVLDVSGGPGADAGPAGDGNIGDDGIPGTGGPGGFAGGFGAAANDGGGKGLGPGGGNFDTGGDPLRGGGGGGFGLVGGRAQASGAFGGDSYGSGALLPLIGGSGGGGGGGGVTFAGGAGGGGGGAILIAASGTLTVTGTVDARGGAGGSVAGAGLGAAGGGGSGGGIRLVATTITGNGTVTAAGGSRGDSPQGLGGGIGGGGRIRVEAESLSDFSVSPNPPIDFAGPGDIFVAGFPSLRITSVAGVGAPIEPTGDADIILASDTPNPVTVTFETSNVPVGNTVTLEVTPNVGSTTTAISDALSGSDALATASVAVDLPEGPSVLQAQLSFTVTAALGDALRNFAQGERVQRIQLAAAPGQGSTTTFITVSGKAYTWPSNAVAMN